MINLNKLLCLLGLALTMSASADTVVDAAASALAVKARSQERLVAAKEQANALIEKVKLAVASLQKDSKNVAASTDLQNALAGKVDSTAQVSQPATVPIVPVPGQTTK